MMMSKKTKTLRSLALSTAMACTLSAPFAAHAGDYMMEHFWAAKPAGTAWVTNYGECWQSLHGQGNLSPCVSEEFIVRLNFEFDKYRVDNIVNDDELMRLNDYIAKVNSTSTREQLSLTGHTDASGSDAYNYQLGLNRANAVRDYMTAQGIPAADMVSVESRGERNLLPNYDPRSVEQRRVVIRSEVGGY